MQNAIEGRHPLGTIVLAETHSRGNTRTVLSIGNDPYQVPDLKKHNTSLMFKKTSRYALKRQRNASENTFQMNMS